MPHPSTIWICVFGALFVWCFGMLATLHSAAKRSCEHGPAWLLAPTLWPLIWPLWLWVLWRERRERLWYDSLDHPADVSTEPLQLVPAGTLYGSPLPAGSLLAPDILAAPYR
ncbi:MAG: hypothetical protein H6839_17990 [Planctomycetes bacterium]|nr:hypothetical protein [Planctomycetota bacterium]